MSKDEKIRVGLIIVLIVCLGSIGYNWWAILKRKPKGEVLKTVGRVIEVDSKFYSYTSGSSLEGNKHTETGYTNKAKVQFTTPNKTVSTASVTYRSEQKEQPGGSLTIYYRAQNPTSVTLISTGPGLPAWQYVLHIVATLVSFVGVMLSGSALT